jgi:hypothetical protein
MKAKKTFAGAKKIRGGSTSRPRRATTRSRRGVANVVVKTKRAAPKRKVQKWKAPARKARLKLPPVLLEGDQPALPPVSGPGEKFTLGPTPPSHHLEPEVAELPEAYGTRRLFLIARDPHCLYATWDLTRQQQLHYNARSADRHLLLRIYVGAAKGRLASEIHVHPESRHWFAHVERPAATYVAELGYYQASQRWTTISTSSVTTTPPASSSPNAGIELATIPAEKPLAKLAALVKKAGREGSPLAQALEELRRSGHPELPALAAAPVAARTPELARTLPEAIGTERVRGPAVGSQEIGKPIHPEEAWEISSLGVAQFGLPSGSAAPVSSVSSPFGGATGQKGFRFNVNVELVIYGASEPDAAVMIGGRIVQLRPDGSFSCRFALPDGEFELPLLAISADQTEGCMTELKFTRKTDSHGDVGVQPHDPALKPPLPENV